MRVPFHVVQARREKLAALIEKHRYLPVGELCRQLGVSEATARRDLNALARCHKLKRTHGGALAEFNERFPSFNERQNAGSRGKLQIARAALRLMRPGGVYFFDSGTTVFALAEEFRARPVSPVTIVTSNLPVGELLSDIPDVQVFQLAGQILGRQSVLLGETACRSLEFWDFHIAFLSAEAANRQGIWNSQEMIVRQQTVATRRSSLVVFCLDARKVGALAPIFLKPWSGSDFLLTDARPQKLKAAGITPDLVRLLPVSPLHPLPDIFELHPENTATAPEMDFSKISS